MLFSELYGTYYKTVGKILDAAMDHDINMFEINQIVHDNAFAESDTSIPSALKEGKWNLFYSDLSTPIDGPVEVPLTILEKRWINAIALDPRIRLFTDEIMTYPEVKPLFKPEDIEVFDCYEDGDPYENENYIRNFRKILKAIDTKEVIQIRFMNRNGKEMESILMPVRLEYSEKDDKFRVIGTNDRSGTTINMASILSCEPYEMKENEDYSHSLNYSPHTVTFELIDERNAMERVMLHFAHFQKEAEKLNETQYRVKVFYDRNDETEIVIRILSFGPMIKVIEPQSFISLIKKRLLQQKNMMNQSSLQKEDIKLFAWNSEKEDKN